MIHKLSPDHKWVKYPAFYNAYPIRNETAAGVDFASAATSPYGDIYVDDFYGRIFDKESHRIAAKYGRSAKMQHYVSIPSLEVIDELRVPYRKIPIFKTGNLEIIERCLAELRAKNRGYQILVRGQTKTHLLELERSPEETVYFYGEEKIREASFRPSHLRNNFDPYFLKCMWQSQAAILLNGLEQGLSGFRNTPHFIHFALGIAQHYGLPSVGLDLTDRVDVACWFATHTMNVADSGEAKTSFVEFNGEQTPTIFLFRCPQDAVFDYNVAKPDGMPVGRPDHQNAWFGHVGWGAASNQLASYLMCGFRLTPAVASQIGPALDVNLFPGASEDLILKHFLHMKGLDKYEGEAKRALQKIYYMNN